MLKIVLVVVTGVSAAVLPPSLSLGLVSNSTLPSQPRITTLTSSFLETLTTNSSLPSLLFPDDRFRMNIVANTNLLPAVPTFMNILNFMGIVAAQDFNHEFQPRVYSAPNYRNVEITSYTRTEGRFLLWGVIYAINYMVEVVRFNDVKMELLWEDSFVGRMKIAVKRSMSLPGGATQDLVAQSNVTGSDNVSVGSGAVGGSALIAFNNSATLLYPPGFSVDFYNIPGGVRLNRNEIFLTFYTALLHVAEFPAGSQWNVFESVSPNEVLTLIMQDLGSGCSVSLPHLCLTLTPREGTWIMKNRYANAYLLA